MPQIEKKRRISLRELWTQSRMADAQARTPLKFYSRTRKRPLNKISASPSSPSSSNKRLLQEVPAKNNPKPHKPKSLKPCKPVSKVTKSQKPAEIMRDMEDGVDTIYGFSEKEAFNIAESLVEWYDKNKRILPWRNKQGEEQSRAYAVWVSEIMLQQTRVAAVISYYNLWMEKWPTIHHLAQATQEEVNHMWAGLGYYRRARFLLEGAKEIVEKRSGVFPSTVEDLKKIPGIGNYTAGAIASIAFNEAVPLVDGNVIRVLCRLKAIAANPKCSSTVKHLWELAGQLVHPKRPGDFNQALMELGATICSVTSPTCSSCPVAENCKALSMVKVFDEKNDDAPQSLKRDGKVVKALSGPSVTDYPVKVPKAAPREEFAAVCVVELFKDEIDNKNFNDCERNMLLLVKRPQKGLLAGLWEFPSVLLDGSNSSVDQRKTAIDQYLENSLGIYVNPKEYDVLLRESIGEYTHVFSHIRLQMYIEWMTVHISDCLPEVKKKMKDENVATWKWIDKKTVQSMGLTSGVRKVYTMIQEFRNNQTMRKASKNKSEIMHYQ